MRILSYPRVRLLHGAINVITMRLADGKYSGAPGQSIHIPYISWRSLQQLACKPSSCPCPCAYHRIESSVTPENIGMIIGRLIIPLADGRITCIYVVMTGPNAVGLLPSLGRAQLHAISAESLCHVRHAFDIPSTLAHLGSR